MTINKRRISLRDEEISHYDPDLDHQQFREDYNEIKNREGRIKKFAEYAELAEYAERVSNAQQTLDSIKQVFRHGPADGTTKTAAKYGEPIDSMIQRVTDIIVDNGYPRITEDTPGHAILLTAVIAGLRRNMTPGEIAFEVITHPQYTGRYTGHTVKGTEQHSNNNQKETNIMAENNQTNNSAANFNFNLGDVMKAKIIGQMAEDPDNIDYSKIMLMQSIQANGAIDFASVTKAKLMGKVMKEMETKNDISIGNCMILQAINSNQPLDPATIFMARMIDKELAEDTKKPANPGNEEPKK
jgi:hypothetical protein